MRTNGLALLTWMGALALSSLLACSGPSGRSGRMPAADAAAGTAREPEVASAAGSHGVPESLRVTSSRARGGEPGDADGSRVRMWMGGRMVELDPARLRAPVCPGSAPAVSCEAEAAMRRASTIGLGYDGGRNPGAVVCGAVAGRIVIARDERGNEDALCEFTDGSFVPCGALYRAALQNDLRK